MKEFIDRINAILMKAISWVIFLMIGFISMAGFVFGGVSLALWIQKNGGDISMIISSFKLVSIIISIIIFLVGLKIYFWLIKKLLKLAEKIKKKRKEDFNKVIKSAIRNELKTAGKKKK